jgi:hypothetical protein
MALVTREELGRKLTIQEMDGNLIYLDKIIAQNYNTTIITLLDSGIETIVRTLVIPANTFKNNDCLQLVVYAFANEPVGVIPPVAGQMCGYVNSNSSLIGASKIFETSYEQNARAINGYVSQILIQDNKFYSNYWDYSTLGTVNNSPIDLTVDNYIIISASSYGISSYTFTTKGIIINKIN